MLNSSIWLIDRTLSGAITPGQSGPGSDGNKGVLHIPQSSSITEASPSDSFASYQDIRWWGGLTLFKDAVVFYSLSRLGTFLLVIFHWNLSNCKYPGHFQRSEPI